ncbi:Transcription factor bHLH110 [Striga hermonthica]|uniref:Transcription factor bHLH110 n=1 Tax=Striga hermonthica TaxID=68872 RepID=A0A9N7NUX6_STRHE|nr:Transcription factor bHLH110 [Striga hermonthica]
MESAKNHHHQLQDQVIVGSSSSSLATPSNYYGGGTTTNAWGTTPTSFLDTNNGFTLYPSTEPRHHQDNNTLLLSQYNSTIVPSLGYHNWAKFGTNQPVQDYLQPPRIKEEFSDHYYRKYTDLLTGNNEQKGFGQIFPSVSVSSLNQMGLTNAGGLDMNLEALDLLTSSSFSGNFGGPSQNQIGILRDGFSTNYGLFDDHMQQSSEIPFYDSSKIPDPISNGAIEAKRSSTKMEAKAPIQHATKKSRLEGRASCPPFKVRKEKLGDRIAALQQLVAPFGKTDTASVLKEAIGYIKFLQDQVETLSVPYMKASRNKSTKLDKTDQNESKEEPKWDLRSRGLCLVPLSCLSYITEGGGGAVWPPSYFGGAV